MEKTMYYTIYKITHRLSGKIYIGSHKTNIIDDGYMGSGKIIVSAIKKYEIENFRKDILVFYDTYDFVLQKETEIVTEEFLQRPDVYNLRKGGIGGFDYINKNGLSSASSHGRIGGISTSIRLKNDSAFLISRGDKISSAMKTEHKTGVRNHTHFGNADWSARATLLAKTPDAIIKRKETMSKIQHQQGAKNSQFGKYWISNDTENKKIKKEELEKYVSEGWRRGRIMRD
jgi:hypothetical protein